MRATGRLGVAALLFGLASLPLAAAAAPDEPPAEPLGEVIDSYVREGLRSNLALRAGTLEVERSLAALEAARARFFPRFSVEARYIRAEGGRVIDFPAGDLLNPIYTTLNELLARQVELDYATAAETLPAEFGGT